MAKTKTDEKKPNPFAEMKKSHGKRLAPPFGKDSDQDDDKKKMPFPPKKGKAAMKKKGNPFGKKK